VPAAFVENGGRVLDADDFPCGIGMGLDDRPAVDPVERAGQCGSRGGCRGRRRDGSPTGLGRAGDVAHTEKHRRHKDRLAKMLHD
jgi:hypothetical protein